MSDSIEKIVAEMRKRAKFLGEFANDYLNVEGDNMAKWADRLASLRQVPEQNWRDAVTEVLLEHADSEIDAPALRDAIFLRVDSPPANPAPPTSGATTINSPEIDSKLIGATQPPAQAGAELPEPEAFAANGKVTKVI